MSCPRDSGFLRVKFVYVPPCFARCSFSSKKIVSLEVFIAKSAERTVFPCNLLVKVHRQTYSRQRMKHTRTHKPHPHSRSTPSLTADTDIDHKLTRTTNSHTTNSCTDAPTQECVFYVDSLGILFYHIRPPPVVRHHAFLKNWPCWLRTHVHVCLCICFVQSC